METNQTLDEITQPASAQGSSIQLVGVIPLFVTLGGLTSNVWFRVMTKIEPGIRLGMSCLDRFLKSIEPIAPRITPIHSESIPILRKLEIPDVVPCINIPKLLRRHSDVLLGDDYEAVNKITLARAVSVSARTQSGYRSSRRHKV